MRKNKMLVIRCSERTLQLWNEVYYELKKKKWTADDVLYWALRELKDSTKYLSGKVY